MSRIRQLVGRWLAEPRDEESPAPDPRVPPDNLLASLYTPWADREASSFAFRDPLRLKIASPVGGLPVPPPHLRMGYAVDDDASYLSGGKHSVDIIRAALHECGLDLGECGTVLDWGCATGRVLRWFADEAERSEHWGVDQDALSISWNQENLSPPFHFLTGTAYPHLPFEDGKFGLVYALSVFTHLEHCVDLWLLEIRRILRRGGVAFFTIHDEHTARAFAGGGRPAWIPQDLSLSEIAEHETTVIRGDRWFETYTFYTDEHVRRAWSRYYEVLAIRPHSEGYQSAVVLRKR